MFRVHRGWLLPNDAKLVVGQSNRFGLAGDPSYSLLLRFGQHVLGIAIHHTVLTFGHRGQHRGLTTPNLPMRGG